MGWTPRRNVEGSASGEATPPRRRRRAVVAAGTDDPVATGIRPRGGKNNQAGYGRDERPRDIKVRLGKRWSEIVRDIKAGEYTWAQFVDGLDEEELARGQLKAEDGSFKGRPPTMVPREFHLACQRELKRRFQELFDKDVIKVAKSYLAAAQDESIPIKERHKMLQYAMERVFGGIPKDVRVSAEQPWEQMVASVMRSPEAPEMPDHLARRYAGYAERQGATQDDEGE